MGGRGRWNSEFKASLVYRVSSRIARATQRNPVLRNKKTKQNKKPRMVTIGTYIPMLSHQGVALFERIRKIRGVWPCWRKCVTGGGL